MSRCPCDASQNAAKNVEQEPLFPLCRALPPVFYLPGFFLTSGPPKNSIFGRHGHNDALLKPIIRLRYKRMKWLLICVASLWPTQKKASNRRSLSLYVPLMDWFFPTNLNRGNISLSLSHFRFLMMRQGFEPSDIQNVIIEWLVGSDKYLHSFIT